MLKVLQTAYPKFYKNLSKKEKEDIIVLWTGMFEEIPSMNVLKAVGEFVKNDNKGFPPTIGQINHLIIKGSFITFDNDHFETPDIEEYRELHKKICGDKEEPTNLSGENLKKHLLKEMLNTIRFGMAEK